MFPLGTVLFPHAPLPLHVFEPRYRALTRTCLAADGRFGVVLIERGSEVGGSDTRFDVGTAAQIVQAAQLPDGRWLLDTVGVERLRVTRWLGDDPHPWAEVEEWPDPPPGSGPASAIAAVEPRLRRLLALRAALGHPSAARTAALSDDPVLASYEASTLSGVGPLDAQHLLAAGSVEERLSRLSVLLDEAIELLEAGPGG